MKKHVEKTDKEGINYWLSYSDMMAALLLVFALIISLAMYQASKGINQLEDIIGVRRDIIEKLFDEFGDDGNITIDRETGDIMLSSQILFDYNKTELKEEGKNFLRDFFPRYINILMSEGIKEHISEVIVEGHTDPAGTYIENLGLSQDRALAVVEYCMEESNKVLNENEIAYLQTVISANGKSFSELKYKEENNFEVDDDRSRRVEIKFRLADEGQIDKIIDMIP